MAEPEQQTQTLSLRISETLRKRLEDFRKLTSLRKGESVSTSEIAKQLLGDWGDWDVLVCHSAQMIDRKGVTWSLTWPDGDNTPHPV